MTDSYLFRTDIHVSLVAKVCQPRTLDPAMQIFRRLLTKTDMAVGIETILVEQRNNQHCCMER